MVTLNKLDTGMEIPCQITKKKDAVVGHLNQGIQYQ
jgi:hypothetical protein